MNYLSGDITDTYSVQKNCVPKCVLEPVRLPLQYGRVELASHIADMLSHSCKAIYAFLEIKSLSTKLIAHGVHDQLGTVQVKLP